MITLEEAKKILTEEDFKKFERLFWIAQSEEYLSPPWYTTRLMMSDILKKYGIKEDI